MHLELYESTRRHASANVPVELLMLLVVRNMLICMVSGHCITLNTPAKPTATSFQLWHATGKMLTKVASMSDKDLTCDMMTISLLGQVYS